MSFSPKDLSNLRDSKFYLKENWEFGLEVRFRTILLLLSCLNSCTTVFGGRVTEAQRTPPKAGEPTRSIRAVALIADIVLFWPGLIVDFATGAIYKPTGNGTVSGSNSGGN